MKKTNQIGIDAGIGCYEKMPVANILNGDVVMLHLEDTVQYLAERRGSRVVLVPQNLSAASPLTYTDSSFRLWVRI